MVDQRVAHEEIVEAINLFNEEKSVYSILATYVNGAEKNGSYVKGYVDGEETYQTFLYEFNLLCKTKFIVRTSWRKLASSLPRRSRYGREERVYWEYNSGNLMIPFSGTPFVVRSCLTKHCQYGSHYYKTTAERISKQYTDHQHDPSVPLPREKKRRNKPSKKRDCPAIMHVREVVLFPEFALDPDTIYNLKCHVRQEKSRLLFKLKSALATHKTRGTPLKCIQRFYLNLPLPEAHAFHPQPCGGVAPAIHPDVVRKIDSLLSSGVYDARHVRVIVHDYVREVLLKQDNIYPFNVVVYPTENTIADYIYMSSITPKSTIAVETDDSNGSDVKAELEGSINELMDLFQTCQNSQSLAEANDDMKKIIDAVKSRVPDESGPERKRSKLSSKCSASSSATTCANSETSDGLTRVVIVQDEGAAEQGTGDLVIDDENILPLGGANQLEIETTTDDDLLSFIPSHSAVDNYEPLEILSNTGHSSSYS